MPGTAQMQSVISGLSCLLLYIPRNTIKEWEESSFRGNSISISRRNTPPIITARKRTGQGNIFTPVCHSVHMGVCLSACWDNTTPPPADQAPPRADTPLGPGTPQEQTPRTRHPPLGADTPQTRHLPLSRHPRPPRSRACRKIRSTSGQYASYWNAILLYIVSFFLCLETLGFTDVR